MEKSIDDYDTREEQLVSLLGEVKYPLSTLIMLLGDGNPGALSILMKIELKHLEALAERKIIGSDIWCLYKDECGEDLERFKASLEDKEAASL
jgi:hypothetical protein